MAQTVLIYTDRGTYTLQVAEYAHVEKKLRGMKHDHYIRNVYFTEDRLALGRLLFLAVRQIWDDTKTLYENVEALLETYKANGTFDEDKVRVWHTTHENWLSREENRPTKEWQI